jgi:hypothetical protein
MGVQDIVRKIEQNAVCTTRERKEKVFMHGKLVGLSRDTDIWCFLHDFVKNLHPLRVAQINELVQLFEKSLKEEIKIYELEKRTNSSVVEVFHSSFYDSKDESNLRILSCLSSICKEFVHLFYSICLIHEKELVTLFSSMLHIHYVSREKTPNQPDNVRQTLQSQLVTQIRYRKDSSSIRVLRQLEREIHAYNTLSRELGTVIQ